MRDVIFALRMLRKAPLVSAIAILALALGIGANAAIFTVVHAVLLKRLPYPQPQQLVQVCRQYATGDNEVFVAVANFLDWRSQNTVFAELAAYDPGNFNLAGAGELPERVGGLRVDTNFLAALGLHPAYGSDFRASDDEPGRPPVALISYALWRSRFGADPSLVGRTVDINSRPVPILGVLPPNFLFPGNPQVLEPLQPEAMTTGRSTNVINVIGRLKPDVSLAAAQQEMHAIGARLSKQYPKADGTHTVGLVPLQQQWTGSQGPTLWMLFGATGLVLLIACADLANLLLAKATARRREIAIRLALGATGGRIVRQLLTESILLALAGGVVGLGIGLAALHAALPFLPAGMLLDPGATT
ncbi:MAG: ABC transporter permease, partial [Terriglobales bacterium]